MRHYFRILRLRRLPVFIGIALLLATAGAGVFMLFSPDENAGSRLVIRSFYYWKNTANELDSAEIRKLDALRIGKLYVKFFEVENSDAYGPVPSGKTELRINTCSRPGSPEDSILENLLPHLEIIPVVFIRNEVLSGISREGIDSLTDNIRFLVSQYYCQRINKDTLVSFKELQIDCDWTPKTRDNYFYLLRSLKRRTGKTLSCTLRLYPYKYPAAMGVPPVDKATLMCYNLVNPLQNPGTNSILDNRELLQYVGNAKKYPLHLDIALPVFSWMQVYHEDRFAGIIGADEIDAGRDLTKVAPLWYELNRDLEVGNLYLRQGDKIKWEQVGAADLEEAIAFLTKEIRTDDPVTVSFFSLDANNLKKYPDERLDHFFAAFAE